MFQKMTGIGVCASALIIAFFSLSYSSGAPPAIPDTAAARAVQDRIQHAYQVDAAVAYSFDLAALATVYVNEPRGGVLWGRWATLVRDEWQATGDPRLNDPNYVIGYLDYKQAFFGWWQRGVEQRERLHARAAREQRDLTPAESRSLIDAAGRIAPARGEADERPATLISLSITIDDDVAVAVVDDGPRTRSIRWSTATTPGSLRARAYSGFTCRRGEDVGKTRGGEDGPRVRGFRGGQKRCSQ